MVLSSVYGEISSFYFVPVDLLWVPWVATESASVS